MPKITAERPADINPDASAGSGELARQQAIQQIRARRRFKISTASAAAALALVAAARAFTGAVVALGPVRGPSGPAAAGLRDGWVLSGPSLRDHKHTSRPPV
jgi:hypothetical protein